MFAVNQKSSKSGMKAVALGTLLALALMAPGAGFGADKKKKKSDVVEETPSAKLLKSMDLSKLVWPNPPAVARVRYLKYLIGEQYVQKQVQKQKSSWMDRVSGVTTGGTAADEKLRFQLVTPYGVASDSKGLIYVADSKVRAIFIFNMETGETRLIKNGVEARFKWVTGMVIDDSDWLYVSDDGMQRILIFDAQQKLQGTITEGIKSPGGLAIDTENRFLYVADAELDQVLVFDADPPFKLLRKIGKTDKEHRLTGPGEFSRPTNVAVDADGNLFVSDTWNDRIEVFDADGNFIRQFGKPGDGPGYFARPKGIGIDSDGNVWVADAVQNRIQAFTPEGRLLTYIGGKGLLPGQFSSLAGLTVDKFDRIITSEQYPGRVQVFKYVTNAQAKVEKERLDAELKLKKASGAATQNSGAKESPSK
jgi:sugar lactone lactonase YvrE